MKTYLKRLLPVAFAVTLAGSAFASSLSVPTGPVLLSVAGAISEKNDGEVAKFDRAMLKEMDWKTIESYTTWTDGVTKFSGVDLATVLKSVGAQGSKFIATALNDYSVEIPISDVEENNVFLALEMNGEVMKVRDKGPIWVIYPQSEEPLSESVFNDKMIWQLKSIEILD